MVSQRGNTKLEVLWKNSMLNRVLWSFKDVHEFKD